MHKGYFYKHYGFCYAVLNGCFRRRIDRTGIETTTIILSCSKNTMMLLRVLYNSLSRYLESRVWSSLPQHPLCCFREIKIFGVDVSLSSSPPLWLSKFQGPLRCWGVQNFCPLCVTGLLREGRVNILYHSTDEPFDWGRSVFKINGWFDWSDKKSDGHTPEWLLEQVSPFNFTIFVHDGQRT